MRPIRDVALLKAGDKLIMRNGTPCKFVTYVPEADPSNQLVVLDLSSNMICARYTDGSVALGCSIGSDVGLPSKVTVWANIYMNANCELMGYIHNSEDRANQSNDNSRSRIGNKAWPIKIDIDQ